MTYEIAISENLEDGFRVETESIMVDEVMLRRMTKMIETAETMTETMGAKTEEMPRGATLKTTKGRIIEIKTPRKRGSTAGVATIVTGSSPAMSTIITTTTGGVFSIL